MIGVTIGGGIGRLMGEFGLLADALQSVRMVGADGRIMTVSATSHADLWWGIRGAGANFGVIISATYKIRPLVNNGKVFLADFYVPAERSKEYFSLIETHYSEMPANLALILVVSWNTTTNSVQIGGDWIYFGTETEGRKILAPAFALNISSTVTEVVPWNKIGSVAGGGFDSILCQENQPRSLFSLNQKKYSAAGYQAGFEKMAAFLTNNPAARASTLVFELFPNQATAAFGDNSSAWPWRDTKGFIQVNFSWSTGDSRMRDAANRLGQTMRADFARTTGYDKPFVFVNYARGDEPIENVYRKDKLPRLVGLKNKYDPDNIFAYYHPIPTKYP
ncbi:hypothetical protein QQS21_004212 [Conoideocrella luteorostrata]|uniref:FAD-binding PCMH-type domain-containing protein n=1 Tax=Conoideocrella luteorostrata TaxID=1105319 RepID=A0AAJ0CUD0_9HYPO|nr:hypothetical protein QQS21_004212 [Conoideocrella luteorostrata]